MYNTYPNPCKGPDHLALPSSCCCRKIVTGAGKIPNISSLRRSLGQEIAIHPRQCDDSASVFRWLKCSNIDDSMLFSQDRYFVLTRQKCYLVKKQRQVHKNCHMRDVILKLFKCTMLINRFFHISSNIFEEFHIPLIFDKRCHSFYIDITTMNKFVNDKPLSISLSVHCKCI